MAQRRPHHNNNRNRARPAAASPFQREVPAPIEKKAPIIYGRPFILLEDGQKATFIYKAGQWVRHTATIAECRQLQCQVKVLPQQINGMTRYEVCSPQLEGA